MSTNKETTPVVPEGFTQSDTDLDGHEAWDFDQELLLAGTVVKIKAVELERDGEHVPVQFAVIDTGTEMRLLWESKNLEDFFSDISAGMMIHVEFTGFKPLKGGKKMRMFNAYFKQA